jgi:hypothetical protein
MKHIGYCVTAFAILIGGQLWKGYVLSLLWLWFVVAAFGAPALSIPAAIGIYNLIGLITFRYQREPKDERELSEKVIESFMLAAIVPAASLAVGAIVRHWL